jgi:hypothetical protein
MATVITTTEKGPTLFINRQFAALIFSAVVFAIAGSAPAAVVWNESVNGDLSNVPTAPTSFNLSVGTNSLIATMPGADLDFATIVVPPNSVLSGIILAGYESIDEISFIAIGPGSQLPASILTYDPTGLLGYAHFGPSSDYPVGADLFDGLSIPQDPLPGFTPPLTSGTYSFWIQQESFIDTGYSLDFIVTAAVPEPTTWLMFVIAGCCLSFGRNRRSGCA